MMRVGRADALPVFDVFGNRRVGEYQVRGIGAGRVVVYPPMANEQRVAEVIGEIVTALDAETKSSKRKAEDTPTE